MSFYLDDYPDDDHQTSSQICRNCSGASFYNDPITGTLTCSSCYTQSQTDTQEELDYDEGIGLAAATGKRTYNLGGGKRKGGAGNRGGKVGRPLSDYDSSRKLPDAESCCLAFQWLLWDASKRVSKLAGIREGHSLHEPGYYSDEDGNGNPSILERTVKKIWFAYLQTWMEATRQYSAKYPELRVSFRDYFLEDIRKSHLMRHLSVTVGKKVEDEVIEEMQNQQREGKWQSDDEDERSISSMDSGHSSSIGGDGGSVFDDASNSLHSTPKNKTKSKKRKRQPYLTIAQLCKHVFPAKPKRHPNGIYEIHSHHAALKIQPSLTLLLSILQLALTHLQTGVAPHHLTMWVANGQLPHVLNGYALLPARLKDRVEVTKKFFMRSFVPPAGVVANLADLLATACSWYGDGMLGNELPNTTESVAGPPNWTALQQANKSLQNTDVNNSSETAILFPKRGSAASSVASGKSNMAASLSFSCHEKSLYNVPLLAARMIQDFGFDQQVFNNTLSLMGVEGGSSWDTSGIRDSDSDTHSQTESKHSTVDNSKKILTNLNALPPRLECALPDKLYTPLHVAAVIVVACKLCPGWETWKITNLHAGSIASSSDTKRQVSSPAFVPWNEPQFQLLGHGPTLDHYMDFLEQTAFNGMEPPNNVAQFFQSLRKDAAALPSLETDLSSPKPTGNKSKVTPNLLLSGAPNPNDPTNDSDPSMLQHCKANNTGSYTSYEYRKRKNKNDIIGLEPYHPHYCRLLEYICFVIEETNTRKLHDLVEGFEEELLSPLGDNANVSYSQRKKRAQSNGQTRR